MKRALNADWPRPTLGWCTAAEVWSNAAAVDLDREELRRDVDQRAASFTRAGLVPLTARRHAIEAALTERQILTITQGGER